MTDDREYEVVLWGATGFTGRLVAEHLAEHYDATDLDWAIAGRNREKLEALREDLAGIDSDWDSLDVLTGDALDRPTLDPIAERAKVVCAAVGPYATFGSGMVRACLEHGTDYCDLTGEVHWMRRVIDEHHEAARERGVRIVHACGFDSVPSDLGTLLVQNHARETLGAPCSTLRAFVTTDSVSFSGGTVAGMTATFEEMSRNPEVRRVLGDPHSLAGPESSAATGSSDEPERSGGSGARGGLWPEFDSDVDQWTGPFVMAVINEKVVHRSNALLDHPWGRDFRYSEVTPTGSGIPGAAAATATAGGLALLNGAMAVSPLRKLLDRFVFPEPGEGPSRETIEESSFEVRLLGTGESPGSGAEFAVEGRIAGDRDPYGATGQMAGEAAVCLARGETDTPLDGGVLTPATGIGTPLMERLRDAGMTFSVGQGDPDGG